MNLKEQNLEEIWHRFSKAGTAADALKEMKLRRKTNFDLEVLLRHHGEEEIDDEDELAMRDAFDDLLAFYSCVEVAAIADFVPDPLPKEFRLTAQAILCNPHVKRYYRTNYPLLLPEMLVARLGGRGVRGDSAESKTGQIFLEFLHISSALDQDASVDMLLWFWDDGYRGNHDWGTTRKILAKPKKLIEALSRSPRRSNASEKAVDGLRKFLGFCGAFDGLLSRSEKFPVLKSAMWHYHSYWFRILRGEVREAVEGTLKSFEGWALEQQAIELSDQDLKVLGRESQASIRRMSRTVRRLTGYKYGKPLTNRKIKDDADRFALKTYPRSR